MVQADPPLHEAFASQCRVAGLDADRGSGADAVEELVPIEHHFHPELGQEPAVKMAGDLETAHRQDHVGHTVYFDTHRRAFRAILQSANNRPTAWTTNYTGTCMELLISRFG